MAFVVRADPVADVQSRLSQEQVAAFRLQREKGALDAAERLLGDVAVLGDELLFMLSHIGQHGVQIFQVDQFQSVVVRDAENDVQDAFLCGREIQDPGQKTGSHIGNGGADRMTLLTVDIPEGNGVGAIGKIITDPELVDAFFHALVLLAGADQTGNISLDIAEEYGNAGIGEGFREDLHGDGLSGTAGTGDEAVAVADIQAHVDAFAIGKTDIDSVGSIHSSTSIC